MTDTPDNEHGIDAWGDDEPFPEPPVASPSYPTATTDRSTELPSWVLVVAERASDGDESLAGRYLASYDPDAYDGHGEATWTEDTDQALRFMKAGDALAFWRQQSSVKPVREDGRDNRPLTAYTMEVRNLAVPS